MLNKPFVLLCLAIFLAYANQSILGPTIPLYVTELGGSASVAGLALLSFSAPSFLVRPWLGRVADRIGLVAMLVIGLASLLIAGGVFFVPYLWAVFVVCVMRGVAWAATNIGGYSYLAHAAPIDRRGEATGYYTSVIGLTQTMCPAIALWMIAGHGGFTGVFAASAAFAALSLIPGYALLKHDRAERAAQAIAKPAADAPPAAKGGVINRGLLVAMILNICQGLPTPAITAFLPLFARDEKIGDVGVYYIMAGVLAVVIRPLLGKRSDTLGQGRIIAAGLAAQMTGFAIIWFSHSLPLVLAGAVIASIGPALVNSATTALAMETGEAHQRGRTMATFSMTNQIGVGFGAVMAGGLTDLIGIRNMYLGPLLVTIMGLAVVATVWKTLPKPGRI
ncbi:MFS transporter [Phenylobacterium immobile]|uniref:MFS transporter n=1 Tax=Phenylobacterium immobile TaxID=21 RepID=UPI000A7B766C|nr:MFS transporter [Phenylobacterium immobile]